MITLRDYQKNAVNSVLADLVHFDRVLLMAATGTGKTIMFLEIIDRFLTDNPTANVLIVAHREELIFQPIERIESFWPHLTLDVGIVMGETNQIGKKITVATVQSLASGRGRLQSIPQPDLIIIDEAHHSVANTYMSVLDAFSQAKVVGCTATPLRTDDIALSSVFEYVSYKITIQDAIRNGSLCPFTPLGFGLPIIPPSGWVPSDSGNDDITGEILSADNIMEIVLEKWREFAGDRQTIGFTSSVAQAHRMAEYFGSHGVSSAAIDGTTPTDERRKILTNYKAGGLQVVFNCMVLTEGFDAPETSALIMVAPTKSDLIYVQRLGRGLRTVEGKKDCVVLDFAPRDSRDIVMATDVLDGVPKRAQDAIERAEKDELLLFNLSVNDLGTIGYIDPMDVKAKVMRYLGRSRLAWSFDGAYAITGINEKSILVISVPDQNRIQKAHERRRRLGGLTPAETAVLDYISTIRLYHVYKQEYGKEDSKRYRWAIEDCGDFPTVQAAKEYADVTFSVNDVLAKKRAAWRRTPATDAQLQYLRRLGTPFEETVGLTKGEAGSLITRLIAMRTLRSHRNSQEQYRYKSATVAGSRESVEPVQPAPQQNSGDDREAAWLYNQAKGRQ